MVKLQFKLFYLIIIILLLLFSTKITNASEGDIYIECPGADNLPILLPILIPGEVFIIDIKVKIESSSLESYVFKLNFDKDALQINTIETGSYGYLDIANENGIIQIYDVNCSQCTDNIYTLTRVSFDVIGPLCTFGNLTLTDAYLYAPLSRPIPNTVTGLDYELVCPEAILTGAPQGQVELHNFEISVGGLGISYYKYSLNNDEYSSEMSVENPISLTNLPEGKYTLKVLGKVGSDWQDEEKPTIAQWEVYIFPPIINEFEPVCGSEAGSTTITIKGSNFIEGATVVFDETEATDVVFQFDQITCTTPQHIPGPVHVIVRNPDGKEFIKKLAYTYYPDSLLYQIVHAHSNYMQLAHGTSFDMDVKYTTSDQDMELTGIGLRIHYNSSHLTWMGISNIFEDANRGFDLKPKNDLENYDNDPGTDKSLQIAWLDLGRKWPGEELPSNLYKVNFLVNDGDFESSIIRFSASSTSRSHDFFPVSVELDLKPFTFTLTTIGYGSISPTGSEGKVMVDYMQDQVFNFIPDAYHHVTDVLIDEVSIGAVNSYTFNDVTEDHSIEVTFIIDSFTLTIQQEGNGTGTVTPKPGEYTHEYGTGVMIYASPLEGSNFGGWSGDFNSQETGSIIVMDMDKTIIATFVSETFLITPTSGPNGTTNPEEPIIVNYNESATVKMAPDKCYEIEDVIINGKSRGPRQTYIFSNVTSNQTIHATFIAKDRDDDKLPDCIETLTNCTDSDNPDSDEDGILDGDEDINLNATVDEGETDPCNNDTDGDLMYDGWEVDYGLNPLSNEDENDDPDNDGYSNVDEWSNQTNPKEQSPPYGLGYVASQDNRQPYQMITTNPLEMNVIPGQIFSFDVNYYNSNNDNSLNGIGIRIHFNSGSIEWQRLEEVLEDKLINSIFAIVSDDDDSDSDSLTDKYLEMIWIDAEKSWPGQLMPTKLCSAFFKVNSELAEGETGKINFSSNRLAQGYNFYGPGLTYTAKKGNLDIDGNGRDDALTDGLLIMGYLFGYRGETLINKAIGDHATRTSSDEIESLLYAMVFNGSLDVDGNGGVNALSDGLILVRYLFGFRDTELIYNVNILNCTRCTPDEIAIYIEEIKPAINK